MVVNAAIKSSVRAFTLIELMISIALVVVLMIGITKVFSLTSNTAGSVNQLAIGIRDARGAQTVFYNDLGNTASDMPFMILRSGVQSAFRSKADKLSDRDGFASTVDVNGNNVEGETGVAGENVKPTDVNNRNHRVDVFSYFVRGLFPRQTGNALPLPGVYVADMSSNEAWIWYGHLRLANNDSVPTYFDPGQITTASPQNDNNQYASDWALGREVILLKAPNSGVIKDRTGTNNQYYTTQSGSFGYSGGTFTANSSAANYTPFAYGSPATDGGGSLSTMQSSRYDLAGTSIGQVSQQVSDYLTWVANNDPSHACTWWSTLMSGDPLISGNAFPTARFQAQTYIAKLQSSDLAYTSPLFIQHCSHFVVEYAGDFLSQEPQYLPSPPNAANTPDPNWGHVNNVYSNTNGTDGVIDFVVNPTTNTQSIRWYGLPRDTNGDGSIPGYTAGIPALVKSSDVIPLRDLWKTSAIAPAAAYTNGAPFERNFLSASPSLAVETDYATGMSAKDFYECVFGPSDPKPKMIRITMTIDDPSGKLPDGQTFQYVIQLH